jgi:hypothetical protein
MKCPKCKFITFDYFDTCPRCGKDMTAEKTRLNIFSIKPNPPFMLGSLTGDMSDSAFGIEALEQTKGEPESIEMKAEEIYDDGSELDITIDEKPVSEPDKDLELDIDDIGMSPESKEVEPDFISDQNTTELKEESVVDEDVSEEAAQETELGKISDELDLESEDLELKIDLEDMKNLDKEPSLDQDKPSESDEGDLELPPLGEEEEEEAAQEEEPEKDEEELDLASEDLELDLELDEDEDTEK